MPRKSLRKAVLEDLEDLHLLRQVRKLLDVVAFDGTSESEDTIEQCMGMAIEGAYEATLNKRYIDRRPYRSGKEQGIFQRDLYEDETGEQLPWLTDDEFLQKYRMSRESFWQLVDLIKNDVVFANEHSKKKQAPVPHQLLVFLHYVGTSGSGANNPRVRNVFGIGRGTAELYRNRVCRAIRALKSEYVKWPEEPERQAIAYRVMEKYRIPNCIAVADGTLLPLMYEPQCVDAPDYHGRKFPYSLSVMIVNDDQRYIRYFLAGFPGCAHDSRVYAATKLAREPQTHFGDKYYLIADSAMVNSPSCVSSFKAPRGHVLEEDCERFNNHNSPLRVTSEHTIGIWKGRFPWLRNIPMKITDNPRSLKKILKYIECCVILHNLLLRWNDESPEVWQEDDGGVTDVEYFDDQLSQPIVPGMAQDESRQRLLAFYKDFVF